MPRICSLGFAIVIALAMALPAHAQTTVTTADIQRLQDNLALAGNEVAQARSRDTARLQADLEDLREEVIYLKVKLRKERSVPRADYADVRDRIENIRSRARGDSAGGYTPSSGVGIGEDSKSTYPDRTGTSSGTGVGL